MSGVAPVPPWPPPLCLLEDSGGDYATWEAKVYTIFRTDFIVSTPRFRGRDVGVRRHPIEDGKEAGYWHLISEGSVERDRIVDPRRCERIGWIRALITLPRGDLRIRVWATTRDGGLRWLVALADFSYVVVLADRKTHLVLITAFCVEYESRQKKLSAEYTAAARKD